MSLFPAAATAPIRTLTLVRSASSSTGSSSGASSGGGGTRAQPQTQTQTQTHLPISSLPLLGDKRIVSRNEPHALQGVRLGSSSSLLFNLEEGGMATGQDGLERKRECVEVRGSPWAKLVIYKSTSLSLTLRSRLLTSSLELFHCTNVSLRINVTSPTSSTQEEAWKLGTLQFDAPLKDVCVSFEEEGMVGSLVLTPLRDGAVADEGVGEDSSEMEDANGETKVDLYLPGFQNVTIRVRRASSRATAGTSTSTSAEEWITYRISSPPVSSAPSVSTAEATQRLLTLEPSSSTEEGADPIWTLDALSRRTNAGYVSLGANPRVRRGSFDSGVDVN